MAPVVAKSGNFELVLRHSFQMPATRVCENVTLAYFQWAICVEDSSIRLSIVQNTTSPGHLGGFRLESSEPRADGT